jgi:hypothetical protein
MAIRILSTQQALSLRGTIPELVIHRSLQFQSKGYTSDDGILLYVEQGDDLADIPEIGPEGFFDENGFPTFEFVEAFSEQDRIILELVYQVSDAFTLAIFADASWFDPSMRSLLMEVSGTPQPLPQLKEVLP